MNDDQLRAVFDKADGHCHFCGDKLVFENRGKHKAGSPGNWELDHVIQRAKGGSASLDNCLPACTRCNRLRWHLSGHELRELLELGLIASEQMRRGTELGRQMERRQEQRQERNRGRRE